jgi:hypothetical protein
MATDGLQDIYPDTLELLDAKSFDAYLTDIPLSETHNAAAETIKAPGTVPERIARVLEAARSIETKRRLISYHGSVLKKALEQDPNLLARIPEEQHAAILELVSRMADDADKEPRGTDG